MEFRIEFIVVIQLLIKIETIYETDVAGEVPIWFCRWGKSCDILVAGESPEIVCLGKSRDVTSRHI